jgi:hypothetical protein
MATLFAWAAPAFFGGSPVDHTWVTDFDVRKKSYPSIKEVIAAKANYWFCWGSYHGKGGTPVIPNGFLGSLSGSISIASCLVKPNLPCAGNPPAQGTVYHYGVDGVCHQLANQVLWATKTAQVGPLTVKMSRGYAISTFLFGTYGLLRQNWQSKITSCKGRGLEAPISNTDSLSYSEEQFMDGPLEDEFEMRVREVLAGAEARDRLRRLLALRAEAHSASFAIRDPLRTNMTKPSGADLNAQHNQVMRQAASILTAAEYRELFGFEPGEVVNLVDPSMVRE